MLIRTSIPPDIRITIYGNPIPKARARIVGKTKKHAFTPKSTQEWESSIYGQILAHRPETLWEGPVALGFIIYKKIPRSWSQNNKLAANDGKILPIGKRDDLDNMLKSIKDACNGILWADDGQVVRYIPIDGIYPGKFYSNTPRIELLIKYIEG